MKKTETGRAKNSIPDTIVMLVFGVFAVSVITVLLLGISSYQRLIESSDTAYEERTCARYIASKLQQAQSPDGIFVGDNDTLFIEEEIDGEKYYTVIYCEDGWLRESFSSAADSDAVEAGERIVPAEAMSVELTDSLILVNVETAGGENVRTAFSLAGGKGL